MGKQFSSNGLHTENSPEYHYFVLNLNDRLKLHDLFPESIDSKILERAQRIKPWLIMPDNRLATFGDTSSTAKWPQEIISEIAINTGINRYWVKDLTSDGLLVVRNNDNNPDYFAVTFAAHSYVHKHADIGQIILFHKGIQFLVDPGKYIYGKSRERDQIVSAISHGVIDSYPTTLHPTHIKLDESCSYCIGSTTTEKSVSISLAFNDKQNNSYQRHIKYMPENSLLINDISHSKNKQYASRLKLNGELTVTSDNNFAFLFTEPNSHTSILTTCESSASLSRCSFGLSKDYGKINDAWVLEIISDSGKDTSWELSFSSKQ